MRVSDQRRQAAASTTTTRPRRWARDVSFVLLAGAALAGIAWALFRAGGDHVRVYVVNGTDHEVSVRGCFATLAVPPHTARMTAGRCRHAKHLAASSEGKVVDEADVPGAGTYVYNVGGTGRVFVVDYSAGYVIYDPSGKSSAPASGAKAVILAELAGRRLVAIGPSDLVLLPGYSLPRELHPIRRVLGIEIMPTEGFDAAGLADYFTQKMTSELAAPTPAAPTPSRDAGPPTRDAGAPTRDARTPTPPTPPKPLGP